MAPKQSANPEAHNSTWNYIILLMSVIILLVALNFSTLTTSRIKHSISEDSLNGRDLEFFVKFDVNKDQVISPEEFANLVKHLSKVEDDIIQTTNGFEISEKSYDPEVDETLRLQVNFSPLVKSTMSQTKKNPSFGSPNFKYSREFKGLVDWTGPNLKSLELQARDFYVFLPHDKLITKPGKPYWLIPQQEANLGDKKVYDSPPPKSEMEQVMLKLLRAFHPNPFINMRFSPQGGVAVVRAENAVYFNIYFRFHCEFQLNRPPLNPYWFTPSQFRGHLIISRDASHVRDFRLYVPNEQKLNVDMEWETLDSDGNMEVDIGYLPLMELKQVAPSSPMHLRNPDGSVLDRRKMWEKGTDIQLEFDKIIWRNEIDAKQAYNEIEKEFFPFKQVEYLPFEDAFNRATEANKLIHQVVLWGALDDQSC